MTLSNRLPRAAFFLTFVLATPLLAGAAPKAPVTAAAAQPKLVVVMVVDGLPNEQVQRYREQFGQGGFRRLLDGASFSNAHQAHGITVTAIGHTAVLTGAYPYQHGIIGNNWIDPVSGASVYCTEDRANTYIGETTKPDDGTSPKNLRVDTLGDQLRYATGNLAKVITVSGKDRGAILLGGKTGTAYMYMEGSGNFASSTFYMPAHPQWVQSYNAAKPQDRYYGKTWTPLLDAAAYSGDAADDTIPVVSNRFPLAIGSKNNLRDGDFYKNLKTSPYLDELTLDFAKAAVDNEQLGRNPAGVPDLLGVSLSAHDYVNHKYGPESTMSHDHLQRLDRMLATFFSYLDQRVGKDNYMVVLTADHGFTNAPEFSQGRHIDAMRIPSKKLVDDLNVHLAAKFALDKAVRIASVPNLYLDYPQIDKNGVARAAVEAEASRFLLDQAGIANVYTRSQFEAGGATGTRMDLLMRRAWNRQLSGDLMVVTKPYVFFGSGNTGSSHGTPYAYDTNVPLLMMGSRWIKPGYYSQYAEVVDLAPTLAHVLKVRPPAASEGRVLTELLR